MSNGHRSTSNGEHSATNRMRAASVRAFDSYAQLQRRANRLLEEMEEVTSPHGVPTTELDKDDSAVTAVEEARETQERVLAAVKG